MGQGSKYSAQDYRSLANSHGFKWIGPLPPNMNTRTKWKCGKGHIWDTTGGSIYNGGGCPYCFGNFPKTDSDYRELAKQCRFKWIAKSVPPKTGAKTTWECARGHVWNATYNSIQQGNRCPQCANDKRRLTESSYRTIANKMGIEWLGPFPPNVQIKTEWKCNKGHIWSAPYANIYSGKGCLKCSGHEKLTESNYKIIAQQRNIEWLGPMP